MPTVRLTAFFKDDDGHGWSEQHDKDGGGAIVALTTYLSNFNDLMQTFRRPLLAGDAFYLGCRASYKTASGAVAGDNIELDPPLRGSQTFAGNDLNMGAPEVAIKARFRNDASTARSDAYFRGQWKETVLAGVLDFGTVLGKEWKRRADLYAAELTKQGGYGWVGIDPALTSRGNVTGYIKNVDGTVTLTVAPTNGVNLPAAGTKMAVKFSRINGSRSIMNRAFVCTVNVGGLTVTTRELVSPSEFQTDGTYIAAVKAFIPYAAVSYYRLSRRKTGRPFGVQPGRLRAAVLH